MRRVAALVAAALLAAVGAVVLGEYDLRGTTAFVAGPLFGVAVAEVGISVAGRVDVVLAVGMAALAVAGLTWALWISTNHFRNPVAVTALAAVALGGACAAGWAWSGRRRGPAPQA